MERLTLKQYRQMVAKVIEFKKLNGKMPAYTIIDGCKITKSVYVEMIETSNKFLLEMGRSPEIVEIGSAKNINCNLMKF